MQGFGQRGLNTKTIPPTGGGDFRNGMEWNVIMYPRHKAGGFRNGIVLIAAFSKLALRLAQTLFSGPTARPD